MKTVPLVLILCCLIATGLEAGPPRCETKVQDGTSFEVCEREDGACDSLAKEQLRNPSDKWNGCSWPATIRKSHYTAVGVVMFITSVMIIASYVDSERLQVMAIPKRKMLQQHFSRYGANAILILS
jgi:hypothetical protein